MASRPIEQTPTPQSIAAYFKANAARAKKAQHMHHEDSTVTRETEYKRPTITSKAIESSGSDDHRRRMKPPCIGFAPTRRSPGPVGAILRLFTLPSFLPFVLLSISTIPKGSHPQ
jgi:hypothetical protein